MDFVLINAEQEAEMQQMQSDMEGNEALLNAFENLMVGNSAQLEDSTTEDCFSVSQDCDSTLSDEERERRLNAIERGKTTSLSPLFAWEQKSISCSARLIWCTLFSVG